MAMKNRNPLQNRKGGGPKIGNSGGHYGLSGRFVQYRHSPFRFLPFLRQAIAAETSDRSLID